MNGLQKKRITVTAAILFAALFVLILFFSVRGLAFPRPCRTVAESTPDPYLIYAVMKAESGFDEKAVSAAGAVGIMQLMPSTAEFIAKLNGIEFQAERLKEAEYNAMLGSLYLEYLSERFPITSTVLAAYNAGEGTVAQWLNDSSISPDGLNLTKIPYPETARYIKKVEKFRKIYAFFYH